MVGSDHGGWPDEQSGRSGHGVLAVVVILLLLVTTVVVIMIVTPGGGSDERAATHTTPEPASLPQATTTSSITTTQPGSALVEQAVGQDIQPGVYMTSGGPLCHWERRVDYIAFAKGDSWGGQQIVEILPSDVTFRSRGCAPWEPYAPPPTQVTRYGTGDWIVGDHIPAGHYRTEDPPSDCNWEQALGLTHNYVEMIHDDYNPGTAPIEVQLSNGERFTSSRCGTCVLVDG